MDDRARDTLELRVEGEGKVGWLKSAVFTVVGLVTANSVELYPQTQVLVVDHHTGVEHVRQVWRAPNQVNAAVAQLTVDLDTMTREAFLEKWVT